MDEVYLSQVKKYTYVQKNALSSLFLFACILFVRMPVPLFSVITSTVSQHDTCLQNGVYNIGYTRLYTPTLLRFDGRGSSTGNCRLEAFFYKKMLQFFKLKYFFYDLIGGRTS